MRIGFVVVNRVVIVALGLSMGLIACSGRGPTAPSNVATHVTMIQPAVASVVSGTVLAEGQKVQVTVPFDLGVDPRESVSVAVCWTQTPEDNTGSSGCSHGGGEAADFLKTTGGQYSAVFEPPRLGNTRTLRFIVTTILRGSVQIVNSIPQKGQDPRVIEQRVDPWDLVIPGCPPNC